MALDLPPPSIYRQIVEFQNIKVPIGKVTSVTVTLKEGPEPIYEVQVVTQGAMGRLGERVQLDFQLPSAEKVKILAGTLFDQMEASPVSNGVNLFAKEFSYCMDLRGEEGSFTLQPLSETVEKSQKTGELALKSAEKLSGISERFKQAFEPYAADLERALQEASQAPNAVQQETLLNLANSLNKMFPKRLTDEELAKLQKITAQN